MKEIYSNINIVGGGLIGSITAYALIKLGYKITILEKKPPYIKKKYSDYRTTAISEGTKNFLNTIGIWPQLKKYSEPINKIEVINRNLSNKLEFDNKRRNSNLGYIIKNRDFLSVVYSNLSKKNNFKIYNNIQLCDLQFNKEKIISNTSKYNIVSDVIIAADGRQSYIKNFFKTPSYNKDYKKTALVLTFTHTINHHNTAFEFFYPNGPLAILPMKKNNGEFCSSIVWTSDDKYIRKLKNIDNSTLIKILNQETHNSVGNIKKIISKQIFPLSAHINSKFFERRAVYVGDSAHSFHPIAGQGWNLGMSDVENLYKLFKKYKSLGIDPGDSFFCKEYHNESFYRAYRLYQITDKLDSIFQIETPIFNFSRSLGLQFINKNKRIKNLLSDFAMGVN